MTRPFEAYLYCIEIVGGGIAKVGVSAHPKRRMWSLVQTGPFTLSMRRVIGFSSRRVADAWERHILAHANCYRGRGEWVVCDASLDRLFDGVTEGEDYTHKMDTVMSCGRVLSRDTDIADVYRVIVKDRLPDTDMSGIEFSGDPDDYIPSIIRGRLRQGYGVEDIALMDQVPLETVRSCVSDIRARGQMNAVLFPDLNMPEPSEPLQTANQGATS